MANKRIVLCFDGTGDWLGSGYTNVAKIYQGLLQGPDQVCFYDGGIGTLDDPRALTAIQRGALRALDLALATSVRDKVLVGYRFLVDQYQPGDRIFLFGFSRGAFTARLVAAMVHNFGILRPHQAHLAPYLWQTISGPKLMSSFIQAGRRIKRDFAEGKVEIEFMGLFDTVGSVGIVRRFETFPNTDFNPSVNRTCHAVSIDERRNVFPESPMDPRQPGLTEVWFPGVHRDIGGGLPSAHSRIADEALAWIELEADYLGLEFVRMHAPDRQVAPRPNYPTYDPYIAFGLYPMRIFDKRAMGFRTRWPYFHHARAIPNEALVHDITREIPDYQPHNLPKDTVPFIPGITGAVPTLPPPASSPQRASEIIAIVLATAAIVLAANAVSGEPLLRNALEVSVLGVPRSGWVASLFFAFLTTQFIGQRYTAEIPKPVYDWLLPALCAALAGTIVSTIAWPVAWIGLAFGALLAFIGQALSPYFAAERVLPYALWGAVGYVLLGGAARTLSSTGLTGTSVARVLPIVAALFVLVDLGLDKELVRSLHRTWTGAGEPIRPDPFFVTALVAWGLLHHVLLTLVEGAGRLFHLPIRTGFAAWTSAVLALLLVVLVVSENVSESVERNAKRIRRIR